jgi:hypothetical protein
MTTRLALFTQHLRSLARADTIPNVSATINAAAWQRGMGICGA